jgi:hypothetical protein
MRGPPNIKRAFHKNGAAVPQTNYQELEKSTDPSRRRAVPGFAPPAFFGNISI